MVFLVLVAAAAFVGGVGFATLTDSPHNDEDFTVFWQSWDILEDEFYFELPDDETMVYSAIQGLLAATGDRYTFFVPPVGAELDRQMTAGEFGGIGAYVSMSPTGEIVITRPFDGLPADEAGLEAGDIVLEVDGISIVGWSLDEAVSLLRGEIGSRVTLLIYRPADDSRFPVEITRARVELPTVDTEMIDDVAYVRLFNFNYRATANLSDAISDLLEQEPRALILDLRGNPGGLLDQAVSVSDLFLGDGVVVTQRSRDGDEVIYRSVDGQLAEDIPLVLLLDGGSASASEVVAGALRDRDRAVLIGTTSFGKGSVQHVHDMPDDSQLHVTVAVWFTPNETPIEGQGLEPDIPVAVPDEPVPGDDPFIEAALSYIDEQFPAGS